MGNQEHNLMWKSTKWKDIDLYSYHINNKDVSFRSPAENKELLCDLGSNTSIVPIFDIQFKNILKTIDSNQVSSIATADSRSQLICIDYHDEIIGDSSLVSESQCTKSILSMYELSILYPYLLFKLMNGIASYTNLITGNIHILTDRENLFYITFDELLQLIESPNTNNVSSKSNMFVHMSRKSDDYWIQHMRNAHFPSEELCEICQGIRKPGERSNSKLNHCSKPFGRTFFDFISTVNGIHILVATCQHTDYMLCAGINSKMGSAASQAAIKLIQEIETLNIHKQIDILCVRVDNEFDQKLFLDFCKDRKIKIEFTPVDRVNKGLQESSNYQLISIATKLLETWKQLTVAEHVHLYGDNFIPAITEFAFCHACLCWNFNHISRHTDMTTMHAIFGPRLSNHWYKRIAIFGQYVWCYKVQSYSKDDRCNKWKRRSLCRYITFNIKNNSHLVFNGHKFIYVQSVYPIHVNLVPGRFVETDVLDINPEFADKIAPSNIEDDESTIDIERLFDIDIGKNNHDPVINQQVIINPEIPQDVNEILIPDVNNDQLTDDEVSDYESDIDEDASFLESESKYNPDSSDAEDSDDIMSLDSELSDMKDHLESSRPIRNRQPPDRYSPSHGYYANSLGGIDECIQVEDECTSSKSVNVDVGYALYMKNLRKKALYLNRLFKMSRIKSSIVQNDSAWHDARMNEIQVLIDMKVISPVKRSELKPNTKVLPFVWVGSVKDDEYVARLSAGGHREDESMRSKVYTPVLQRPTMNMSIVFALARHMFIGSADYTRAYLNASLKEGVDIFIQCPLEAKILFNIPESEDVVLKLDRALYGLTQSGSQWHIQIIDYLKSLGYQPFEFDSCTLIHPDGSIILLYVDDMIIIAKHEKQYDEICNKLSLKFKMKKLGKLSKYLGVQFVYHNNNMYVHMEKFCDHLFQDYKNVITDKMLNNVGLPNILRNASSKKKVPITQYRSIIGKLSYIAHIFRHDIAYSVNILSRYQSGQFVDLYYFNNALKIVGYLYNTKHTHLVYPRNSAECKWCIDLYVDANLDNYGPSTSGFVMGIRNDDNMSLSLLQAKTSKQKLMSMSTKIAEFNSLFDSIIHLEFIVQNCRDLVNHIDSVNVFTDAQLVIDAIKNNHLNKISKRVVDNRRIRFAQMLIKDNKYNVKYVKSEDNPADLFTKILSMGDLKRLARIFGLFIINNQEAVPSDNEPLSKKRIV